MKKLLSGCLFTILLVAISARGQEPSAAQGIEQDKGAAQTAQAALVAYTKWRDDVLRNYRQGSLTPHYAFAIVARRLDNHTAQVEMLIAADMKHYTITIRPVTLARQPSGEYLTSPVGNAVTINQKAGRKFGTGPDKIRIGDSTTLVAVTSGAQALEISWAPKNDKPDDPVNTCLVRLGREPGGGGQRVHRGRAAEVKAGRGDSRYFEFAVFAEPCGSF